VPLSINPVHISQETHYISATETNRLMLFRETVALWNTQTHVHHVDGMVRIVTIELVRAEVTKMRAFVYVCGRML
jgi:hypothetical protein